jgi:transcriptional regulator with XRE-family HTH domain
MSTKAEEERERERRIRVGAALRAARERCQQTLADIKKSIGLSIPYLSDAERGNRDIKSRNLHAYVIALQLAPKDVYTIFKEAACLPPTITTQVLSAPDVWKYDLPKSIQVVKVAHRFLAGQASKDDLKKAVTAASQIMSAWTREA